MVKLNGLFGLDGGIIELGFYFKLIHDVQVS